MLQTRNPGLPKAGKSSNTCLRIAVKEEGMDHRILGKTGLTVSILTFGGIVVGGMEAGEASEVVAEAVDSGVLYYDVAPSYGNAQYVLGPALEPHRSKVLLACKTEKRSAKGAREELEESLRALKTDHFDNYQMHALDDPDEIEQAFGPGGSMETFVWAKKQGYTRNIGFTCHRDESALKILSKSSEFDTMLFPVNFAYRLKKEGSVSAVAAAKERGLGVVAIKALARRHWLEGEEREYPKCWYRPIYDDDRLARLALNFTLSQDIDTAVPPGDKRMFRLALSIIQSQGGKAVPLSPEELEELKEAALGTKEVIF
jgi:aryl-alcohol dehydrogenase-like predicted oxidoreductase